MSVREQHPRVRFAPSPTGRIHIGNIRTAIFNWLYARHVKGRFLLRIEDTDKERSTEAAINQLFAELQWLGLDFDEEPLWQSSRNTEHLRAAAWLVDRNRAYRYSKGEGGEVTQFRIPWDGASSELIRQRETVELAIHPDLPIRMDKTGISYAGISRKGKPMPAQACLAGFRYLRIFNDSGRCLFEIESAIDDISGSHEGIIVSGGVKMKFLRREVRFHDTIRGELSKPLDGLKDFVILRHDGSAVFHLANVSDDGYQNITHIIRGDDHIENTYRHVLLSAALERPPPKYTHLPMIINSQGKPYSKRDGDAYVGELRDHGFLPQAVFNYLSLLGWSPGNDMEKLSRTELIDAFTLERIQASPAQMDMRKLLHLNGLYMAETPVAEFVKRSKDLIEEESWGKNIDFRYFERVARLMQSRTKVYSQVKDWLYFFSDDLQFDDKAVAKHIHKPGIEKAFAYLSQRLSEIAEFTEPECEQAVSETTAHCQINPGKLNLPIRIAITGTLVGAGIFEVMSLLGKHRVMKRLEYAIEELCRQSSA